MVELTTNEQPYISTINDKKSHVFSRHYEVFIEKKKKPSFHTGHPHIYIYTYMYKEWRKQNNFASCAFHTHIYVCKRKEGH